MSARPRAKRPLGHDLVVATLVLASCSTVREREGAREVIATIKTPTHVRVERIDVEVTRTAGCGSKGGGGGRGAISYPSCEGTHCTSATETYHRCEVVVERDKPASQGASCSKSPENDLAMDSPGERFAVRGDAWTIYAGGWEGKLVTAIDVNGQPLEVKERELDWTLVPAAHEILRRELAVVLTRDGSDASAYERFSVLFSNLEHVAREHLVDDLVSLAPTDTHLNVCPTRESPWTTEYDKQSAATKAAIVAMLAPMLVSQDADAVIHAIRFLDAKGVVEQAGEPSQFLARKGADTKATHLTRAAVRDAWSQTSPGAAAKDSCAALASPLDRLEEAAALTAIARAGLKCPAVLALKPEKCGWLPKLAELPAGHKPTPTTAFCEPEHAFVYALLLANPKLGDDDFGKMCDDAPDAALASDATAD